MEFSNADFDLSVLDVSLVCRGCLASTGEMKNMIEWGLVDDFQKLTAIQVNKSDGLSQLLCSTCEDVLNQLARFKAQCKQSDVLLKNTKEKNETQDEYLQQNNTTQLNLENDKLILEIIAPNMLDKVYLPCPYCVKRDFIKKSDLLSHIYKEHKLKLTIEVNYYCSINDCSYNIKSGKKKSFNGRKFLNQHVNKVHNNKELHCDICKLKFATETDFKRHLKTCNNVYMCQICNIDYSTNEKLLVHLLRRHPDLHKEYKIRKAEKRKAVIKDIGSPKRSFATQTFGEIKNDVTFWNDVRKDEISTQTVFDDVLLKSNDDSIFSEVSLSDIQTQTLPTEFGLCKSNKETITETQISDFSIKETQTCVCLYEKSNLDNVHPFSVLTSTETQTLDRTDFVHDVLLSSAETQTCFDLKDL